MPLGMKVGIGSSNFVLDGDPAPPSQNDGGDPYPLIFGPCLLWPNAWMDKDATWYGGRHCTLTLIIALGNLTL